MDTALQTFYAALDTSGRNYNREKIDAAYAYADELHAGQKRLSGEPYISHPLAVATIVVELGLDTDSVCAALLHDTVEDCSDKTSLDIVRERFGADVALFVDGLAWSIVQQNEVPVFDEEGEQTGTEMQETEFDNSEYCLAGAITDHRDGTITVKMGKPTQAEELEAKLANAVTEEELAAAYEEGVNRA